jgi:hypothetical protein
MAIDELNAEASGVYNRYHKDAPPDAIYIGRGTPRGNRFPITPEMAREQAVERFKCEQLPELDLRPLIGRSVVCSCYPALCHGNPLIEAVEALGKRMLCSVAATMTRRGTCTTFSTSPMSANPSR